jgi:hypothetical protein
MTYCDIWVSYSYWQIINWTENVWQFHTHNIKLLCLEQFVGKGGDDAAFHKLSSFSEKYEWLGMFLFGVHMFFQICLLWFVIQQISQCTG